jgi:hypothetical protein
VSLLHIQFRGLEEGTDPKTQPVGALLAALNCRMDKARRIHKRWGTAGYETAIVGGGNISAGARLVELSDGNIGLIDGTNLYTWVDDPEQWKLVDRVCPLRVTRRPHIDNAASVAAMDHAVSANLLVSVWSLPDSTYGVGTTDVPVFFQVVDTATNDIVYPPTQLTSTGHRPRVVIFNGKAVFVWNNSSGELAYRDLTLSSLTLGTAGTLDTGLATGGSLDVHVAGSTLYAVYKLGAGANRTRIQGFDTSYASSIGPTDVGLTTQSGYRLHVTSGENAYVLASDSAGAHLYTLDPATLTVTAGPTTVLASAGSMFATGAFVARESSTTCLVGASELESMNGLSVRRATTMVVNGSTHAITANTTRRTNHVQWQSEPFQVSSRWYAVAQTFAGSTSSSEAPSDVLLEIRTSAYSAAVATHAHVGTLENQTAGQSGGETAYTTPVDSNGVAWVASQFRRDERDDQFKPIGVNMNRVTTGGDIFRPLRNGRVTMLVGAAPIVADGYTTAPYGFIHGPRIGTITWSGAGGSVTAGAYQYAAYYVRQGPDGVLQRSGVANIATTTAGATDTGTIPFATSCVDAKLSEQTGFSNTASPVRILAHRTEDDGSVLYMLAFEPSHNVVTSSPTTAVVTLTDTRADSSIAGASVTVALSSRPTLYTDTELDDLPPPAATTGTVHRNRFWLISADESTVWVSKDASEDLSIAPGFNEALTLQFASRKRALASLDDKLVAFGDDDIDIVHGDGPDSNGDNNTWSISRLQTDVGCVNPRSVVVTPFGVIFESRRGLEMLDRGLNVSPVGQAIEDQLASYPTITSAVLVAEESEVRFTCNNTAGTSGIVIVWDYYNKFWHTRKYNDVLGTDNTSTPFVDAALIGGEYHLLTSGGILYREDKDTYLDAGSVWAERDVQLAWIAPGGPNAWHRFRRWQVLGTNVGNHDLKLSVARDYATSWEQDNTFAAQTTPTTIGPTQQARITPQYQKATAQRLRLQDLTPTTGTVGEGPGPIWEAVTLEYDVLSRTARTSAAEQA